MNWNKAWTLTLPGMRPGTIGTDPLTASLLIADGWGVAFAALEVRKVEAASGRVVATVRTRTPIRAFGRAAQSTADAFFFVGDEKIFLHDATTLERLSVHEERVPRYSNAISDIGGSLVSLAAPNALVEYDWQTSKSHRVTKVPAVAHAFVDQRLVALLADGTVLARATDWEPVGTFGQPHFAGVIDAESALVTGLAGERAAPYDSNGNPQPVPAPRSRSLQIASLRGQWQPRSLELPFSAITVGVVGDMLVAIQDIQGVQTTVAHAPIGLTQAARIDTLPGQFAAFAGPHGLVMLLPAPDRGSITLSLFTPSGR